MSTNDRPPTPVSAPSRTIRNSRAKLAPGRSDEVSIEEFAATTSAIASAFGDPTRRRVYLAAHEAGQAGISASTIAASFGLHPNVARHHLQKLAAGGYLEVVPATHSKTKGRPSVHYRAAKKLELANRGTTLVSKLLGRLIEILPPEEVAAQAEQIGFDYGQELAQQLGPMALRTSTISAVRSVVEALTAHGFDAHLESTGNEVSIVSDHCPFGATALEHPVICAVDRGIVNGMLNFLSGASDAELHSSKSQGDALCKVTVY